MQTSELRMWVGLPRNFTWISQNTYPCVPFPSDKF